MARLSSDLHPLLTLDVLKKLFENSIFTTLAFVRKKNAFLANISGLQYGEIGKIKDKILSKCSSSLRRGDKYYRNVVKNSSVVSSGIGQLDELLKGGFVTGNIYEFCGSEASGKTQLCMSLALRITLTTGHHVLFIDTKYDMSVARMIKMLKANEEVKTAEIFDRINICHPTNAWKLLNDLYCLKAGLLEAKDEYMPFKFLILDSLSVLFQNFCNITEGLSILNNIASVLTFLASEFHMVVLVTNFVFSWTLPVRASSDDNEYVKSSVIPALGKYWAHIPTTTVTIMRSACLDECLLTVTKTRTHAPGESVKVTIDDRGVL